MSLCEDAVTSLPFLILYVSRIILSFYLNFSIIFYTNYILHTDPESGNKKGREIQVIKRIYAPL